MSRVEDFHRAEDASERGKGICRTCLAPIWNEGGWVDGRQHAEGWSDRVGRRDTLVCFSAVNYRHVPLDGREACIYDRAYALGAASSGSTGRRNANGPHIAAVSGVSEPAETHEHPKEKQ